VQFSALINPNVRPSIITFDNLYVQRFGIVEILYVQQCETSGIVNIIETLMLPGTVESSRAGDRLESRKVQARANIRAGFPGEVRSSGDGAIKR